MKHFLLISAVWFFSVTASAQLVDGTYRHSCFLDGEDFIQRSWTISKGVWIRLQVAHEEGTCKSPWLSYEESYNLAFLKFNKLNLLNTQARYMPHTQEVADVLNSIQFCEINNWQAKAWHHVSGRKCQDFTPPKINQILYSIISISDLGFQMGEGREGAEGISEATRHKELSPLVFEMQ